MSHLPQVGLVGYHAYSILELREVDAQVSGDINGKVTPKEFWKLPKRNRVILFGSDERSKT